MLLLICGSISFAQNDKAIFWSSDYKLQWKDYLAELDTTVFAYAKTSYKIEVIPKNVLVDENDKIVNIKDLSAVANFYKNYSWSISNDIELLKHEQIHFDIAEIFARKIRKRFSELKKNNENTFSVYFSEYKRLWAMCRSYQNKYDQETNHGAKLTKNNEWFLMVEKQISELDAFSK